MIRPPYPRPLEPDREGGLPPEYAPARRAIRDLRRRVALRLGTPYLLFLVLVTPAPEFLHRPLLGRVTGAFLLAALVLGSTLWAVAGHRRDSARLEAVLAGPEGGILP